MKIYAVTLVLIALVANANDNNPGSQSVANDNVIAYPAMSSNVSFQAVSQLDTHQPYAQYRYGDSEFQYGELWLPPKVKQTKAPIVVLIHGGCWLNAFDIKHTYAASTALSQAGYAVWSLEYRRSGDAGGGWPGTFQDITQGIEYLESIHNSTLDLNNIVVMGHSAGGHLALWYSAQKSQPKALKIKGYIGLAAIVDLATYARGSNSCQSATPRFMGGPPERFAKRYAMANPANLALPKTVRLIHGTHDKLVPVEQAKRSQLPTIWIDGAGHFDLIYPGTPAWIKILEQLKEMLR